MYRVIEEDALTSYEENGMTFEPGQGSVNGLLIIQAEDEETADKIRMTFTDIRMWKKVEDGGQLDN
jgi:hypothetical protein